MRVIDLGLCDYLSTYQAMRAWSEQRKPHTVDELWLCQHHPVYTQGIAGKAEHVLAARGVSVVQTNRGGQVTYHGPGQVVAYPLVDLGRLSLHVKTYVFRLENALLKVLESLGVTGHRIAGAPGIYVQQHDPFGHAVLPAPKSEADRFVGMAKIAALGIKVSRHCAYHGVALNVAMDLSPFLDINPCGYKGLATVDLATLGVHASCSDVAATLAERLAHQLAPPPP